MQNRDQKKLKIESLYNGLSKEKPCRPTNYFGETLREFRAKKGYSQTELAILCNVSQSLVAAWEIGRSKPDVDQMFDLCHYLDVNPMDFFENLLNKSISVIEQKNKIANN